MREEVDNWKVDAGQLVTNIYKMDDQETAFQYLTIIESKQFVRDQIQQFKVDLVALIKEGNALNLTRVAEQKQLAALRSQLQLLEVQAPPDVQAQVRVARLARESAEVQQRLDMELLHSE